MGKGIDGYWLSQFITWLHDHVDRMAHLRVLGANDRRPPVDHFVPGNRKFQRVPHQFFQRARRLSVEPP